MKLRAFVSAPIGRGTNPFLAKSGKFGVLRVEYKSGGKYDNRVEVTCFSDLVPMLQKLSPGEEVDVEFDLSSKKLTDKAGADVLVDGYAKYVNVVTARNITVVGGGGASRVTDGDDIPF